MISTKEKILLEALTLFSKNSYDAITVNQIAQIVGIKAPSLYKHYRSKQEIFDAIILKMTGISPKQDMNRLINMDELELINIGKNMFTYFLHDVVQSKFRKMLTIEQFKNKNLADQYIKQYFDYSLSYHQYIFSILTKQDILKKRRFLYYCPPFLWTNLFSYFTM